ncbi:hypothetical protein GGS26DRAFT_513552 [Hypomontagnella submonticulosa]|nr:hypothetical protein GGS26DRAFT_513552 [Hypomontagnella submonticulosa]
MEKHSEESRDPLLRQSAEEGTIRLDDASRERKNGHQPICTWLRANTLSLAIFFLLFYIAVALTVEIAMRFTGLPPPKISHGYTASLGNTVEFEQRAEWGPPQHPWNQDPSEELDAAWDDLLYAINIKVKEGELAVLGIDKTNRVQVNGGSYIGSIGVYHHLHCLNNLRMVVHWDYYEKQFAGSPYRDHLGKAHSDHCINALREAVMCHANTAITTFEWVDEDNSLQGKEQRLEALTTCAKWDSVDNWARQRVLVSGNYTYRPGPFQRSKPKSNHIE